MSDDAPPQPYGFLGLLWRFSLAAVIVLGLSATAGFLAVKYLVETPEVQAPDLITLELTEALATASRLDFALLIEKREPTELLSPGRVLSQRPGASQWTKPGAVIRITVSEAP
jgi:beta-lactam-binding protein with PASTA domain